MTFSLEDAEALLKEAGLPSHLSEPLRGALCRAEEDHDFYQAAAQENQRSYIRELKTLGHT